MKNKSSKKEKDVDVIARHLVGMETRINKKFDEKFDVIDERLDGMNKRMGDMNFKLDKVTFSHGRRIEVLEDSVIVLKKLTHKK